MKQIHLVAAVVVVSLAGCNCDPKLGRAKGTVQWEWVSSDGVPHVESQAVVDFGTISMGARRDQTLKVRNTGAASFTLSEFAHLMGSPVSINNVAVEGQSFMLTFDPEVSLAPTDETTVSVAFIPPIVVEPFVDHTADLELKPQGADASTLSLRGRAIAGACALPETIDFGTLPIGRSSDYQLELNNNGEVAIRFTAGGVLEVPVDSYYVLGLTDGAANIAPGGTTTITVRFSPQEPREYAGTVNMRRGEACPEQVVHLQGRGVTSCLTWKPDPADAASGQVLSYGAVPPGAVKEGTVTFLNQCTVPVELSRLRTNEATFAMTSPTDGNLSVPAAQRDEAGGWVEGSARTVIDFRPVALGARNGLMLCDTDLASQQAITVSLRGYGGGPIIDARPAPLNFGRVGFSTDSPTQLVALRTIRITNVGTRPMPVDPEANLHLGPNGGMKYAVRALSGGAEELCVGEWNATTNACDGTIGNAYDEANGIEVGTAGISLPVRLVPRTEGMKEYELTIFSNDIATPEKKIQILANAVIAPPCNFQAAPTVLNFGLIDAPQTRELTFTLTNLGTNPGEICLFSGFELSPTSHAMFSLPNAPTDLEVPANSSATITVRAAPQTAAGSAAAVSGQVTFNVPTTAAGNSGSVDLAATLSPSCLTITPLPLDFGNARLACGSPARNVVITNSCTNAVTYNGVMLTDEAVAPNGTGTCASNGGCPQFEIVSAGTPGTLNPSDSRVVSLRFRPYSTGAFTGRLVVNMQQGSTPTPYEVELRGTGIPDTGTPCISATCPPPMTVQANTTVTLNATVMTTGAPTCLWSPVMRPSTSNGAFSAPTNCNTTNYFADVVGTHLVGLNVSDSAGGMEQCQTPITVLPSGDLWIEMTWSANYDLDLALLNSMGPPNNSAGAWSNTNWSCNYIRYGNRPLGLHFNAGSWWQTAVTPFAQQPTLDRDDMTGRGPENIRINSPSTAVYYTIGSHMYGSSVPSAGITSTIKLYCGGSLVTTETRTMTTAKQLWVVGTVQFPGVGGQPCTFTPVNSTINNVAF